MTTKTRLTALALAVAVLSTGTALAGTATDPVLDKIRKPGEVAAQKQVPTAGTNVGSIIKKLPPGELGSLTGQLQPPASGTHVGGIINKLPPGELGGIVGQLQPPTIKPFPVCIVGRPCNLPTPPKPPVPFPPPGHPCPTWGCDHPPVTGKGDHDGDHDGDYGHGYGYGYGYGWRERPEVVIEGAPAAVAVPAPVVVQARVPVAAQPVTAQPVVTQEPCNCLTKQSLPDGSVLFQDICTKQSALAPAPVAAAQ